MVASQEGVEGTAVARLGRGHQGGVAAVVGDQGSVPVLRRR